MASTVPQLGLSELETPALLLDQARMQGNIARLRERLASLKVAFRPHVKTAKCLEIVTAMCGGGPGPITVSTLREADWFAERGFRDILYAVGIAPNKLEHAAALARQGVRLTLILDHLESARFLAEHAARLPPGIHLLLEIDSDGHRAGIGPEEPLLLEVANLLRGAGLALEGVMTHAGGSYDCRSEAALRACAEQERALTVRAVERLRAAGHLAPTVSVGSTPTALFAERLDGVTEVRAGVFVFFDLVMAGLGVCRLDELALSVLTSVIGQQREKGWTLVDAGWMALSRDRGTAAQPLDQGYGLVCDRHGLPLHDYLLIAVNQEHGIIAPRPGSLAPMLDLPPGSLLRILPNHACATAAQHSRYQVLDEQQQIAAVWERFGGW